MELIFFNSITTVNYDLKKGLTVQEHLENLKKLGLDIDVPCNVSRKDQFDDLYLYPEDGVLGFSYINDNHGEYWGEIGEFLNIFNNEELLENYYNSEDNPFYACLKDYEDGRFEVRYMPEYDVYWLNNESYCLLNW